MLHSAVAKGMFILDIFFSKPSSGRFDCFLGGTLFVVCLLVGFEWFSSAKALVSKFGTLSRAWRLGLDVDGSGKMDMREFCEVLRAM